MSARRLKIASGILYVVVVIFILSGLVYSFTPRILPYHEHFLGKTHEQLDPLMAELFLKALRVIGGAHLALAVAFFVLVRYFFSRGDNRIRWTILITGMLAFVPICIVTINVGIWFAILVPITLIIASFIISKPGEPGS